MSDRVESIQLLSLIERSQGVVKLCLDVVSRMENEPGTVQEIGEFLTVKQAMGIVYKLRERLQKELERRLAHHAGDSRVRYTSGEPTGLEIEKGREDGDAS